MGESYRRRIVLVRVHTTEEQDRRLMEWLNERANVSHFNIFSSNCADFTAIVFRGLFSSGFRRSYLFDAGIMTPKQNLSSLRGYWKHHPEVGWQVSVLPRVPGTIPRSGHLRGVTEAYLKTWWFLLPLDALDPVELGTVTALGVFDHRYNVKTADLAPDEEFFAHTPLLSFAGKP